MLVAVLLLISAGRAVAQTSTVLDGDAHYAYAVFVGTGWYKLDDRQIFVFRIPAAMQLRELKPDQMGIRLLLPVAIGIHNFDTLDVTGFDIDNIGTISFVPGVEFQFKPGPKWEVKPFGQLGVGWEDDGDLDSIFGLGTRTNYTIPRGSGAFVIGAEYLLAGEAGNDGGSSNINRVGLGIEYKHPISWSLFNRQTSMHWRFIAYNYIGGLEVRSFPDTASYEIDSVLQVGFSLSVNPGLKIIGIPFSHLGLGFRFGQHTRAIVIETKFPF